jgi:hypothetical protein
MSARPVYVVAALVGILVGLGGATFRYTEGLSYFRQGQPATLAAGR